MKILMVLDPFGDSGTILDESLRLAEARGAELTVLALVNVLPTHEHDWAEQSEACNKALLVQVGRKLDAVRIAAREHGVTPTFRVSEAAPSHVQAILDWAEEEDADLIVLGNNEREEPVDSVAANTVAYAQCSVLVVR